MRPLRWPRLWLAVWGVAVLSVIALSLLPPPDAGLDLPRNSDKLMHFSAYLALMFSAVQLFAGAPCQRAVAVGLVVLSCTLEWAQGALVPEARSADVLDGVANSLGVIVGFALRRTPAAHWLQRLERCIGGAAR